MWRKNKPQKQQNSLIISARNIQKDEIIELDYKNKMKPEAVQILRSSYVNCIPDRAFQGNTRLKSVYIETDATTMERYALYGVTVTSIGNRAFSGCTSLESIVIPNGVTTIENSAFDGCSSLKAFVIPNGVTTIGGCAFHGCSSLKAIAIPSSVTTIKNSAFSGCSSLESIAVPNGVTTIKNRAFKGCSSLESIVIPNGVTAIGTDAFEGCESLDSIVIPIGLTIIECGAFYGCTSLKSVDIPNGVTTIKSSAFYGCSSLELIEVPESATHIGEGVFYGCKSLERRQENGINYHPDSTTWLQQRFNNLPIHRVCYHANNNNNNTQSSLNLLSRLIQQNKHSLVATDAMGMTPLHILCCNPNVAIEMVRVMIEGDLLVLTQRDLTQSTPFQLFLKHRNLLEVGQDTMSSLHDLLESEIKGEDLDILLVLDSNQQIDLSSQDVNRAGLLPYMSAATLRKYRLDLVHRLTMHSNLGMIS